MSKRAQKKLQAGLDKVENFFESTVETHMEYVKANEQRSKIGLVLGAIPHLVALLFPAVIVWIAKPSSSLFSWHPTLMSLGFMLLMSEAILIFSRWSSPVYTHPRSSKTSWHWLLHTSAMVCIYTALVVISVVKYQGGKPHYSTWHAQAGLVACGLLAIEASGGLLQLYPDILPFKLRPVTVKRLHAFSGVVTYTTLTATTVLGLYSSWFLANTTYDLLWKACVAAPPIVLIAMVIQVARNHLTWL